MSVSRTTDFLEMFDWEKESALHYYSMMEKEHYEYEMRRQPAKIILKKNENKLKCKSFPRTCKRILHLRENF